MVDFNLPATEMDLSQAPKELQDQIKAGKKVVIRDVQKNNTVSIVGIKKINNSYTSFEVAFDTVTEEKNKEYLFRKTNSRELNNNLARAELARQLNSNFSITANIAEANSSWPVAWVNSRTDSYPGVDVAWSLGLYRHPDNPNNSKQKVYVETIFMDITNKRASNGWPNSLRSAWPKISPGYKYSTVTYTGMMTDFTPTQADYSNSTSYSLSVGPAPAFTWTITSSNLGTGLHLSTYVDSRTMGTTLDNIRWKAIVEDLLDRQAAALNGLNVKPGVTFWVPASQTNVLARGEYWTYSTHKGDNTYYWDYNYMHYAPLNQ